MAPAFGGRFVVLALFVWGASGSELSCAPGAGSGTCATSLLNVRQQLGRHPGEAPRASRSAREASLVQRGAAEEGGIEHAEHGECDALLGVNFSAPQKDIDVRHHLFSGAKLIVDIGGNVGEDIDAYTKRFPDSKVLVYEPVPEFFDALKAKFGANSHVKLNEFGVSDKARTATFNIDGVGSSGLDKTGKGKHIKVPLHDVDSVLSEATKAEGRSPDVVSVNCEGCEYSVFQRMSEKGWLEKVPFIQMSWHIVDGIGKNRVKKRCEVERALRKSHDPVYYSAFGWQGWKRRGL